LRLIDEEHPVRWFSGGHGRLSIRLPLRLLCKLRIDEDELGGEQRRRHGASVRR
jgi:hypothetical protein